MRWLLSLPILLAQVTFLGWQGGCLSWANREGPTVTCADLGEGATNACSDGIIARCSAGRMTYEVCDDKDACNASWQQQGRFQCVQSSVGGSGGNGGGNNGGSGHGGAGLGGSGGVANGGSGGNSGGAGGATSCTPDSVCTLGSVDTGRVDALALDSAAVYFSNCHTIWGVPKTGGFANVVASGLTGCATGNISVDSSHVYFVQHDNLYSTGTIGRAPKAGGPVETVVTSSQALFAATSDDSNIYWIEGQSSVGCAVRRAPKAGGSTVTLSTSTSIDQTSGGYKLIVSAGYLYWCKGQAVLRVATDATVPATPASLALGQNMTDFGMATDAAFLTVQNTIVNGQSTGSSIWRLPLTGGTATQLAVDLKMPGYVALDESFVYWRGLDGIFKTGKSGGGAVASVASVNMNEWAGIAVDDQYAYWADGYANAVKRAPK